MVKNIQEWNRQSGNYMEYALNNIRETMSIASNSQQNFSLHFSASDGFSNGYEFKFHFFNVKTLGTYNQYVTIERIKKDTKEIFKINVLSFCLFNVMFCDLVITDNTGKIFYTRKDTMKDTKCYVIFETQFGYSEKKAKHLIEINGMSYDKYLECAK